MEEKIALTYRLLNKSVGLLNQKVDSIAGSDTAINENSKVGRSYVGQMGSSYQHYTTLVHKCGEKIREKESDANQLP